MAYFYRSTFPKGSKYLHYEMSFLLFVFVGWRKELQHSLAGANSRKKVSQMQFNSQDKIAPGGLMAETVSPQTERRFLHVSETIRYPWAVLNDAVCVCVRARGSVVQGSSLT